VPPVPALQAEVQVAASWSVVASDPAQGLAACAFRSRASAAGGMRCAPQHLARRVLLREGPHGRRHERALAGRFHGEL